MSGERRPTGTSDRKEDLHYLKYMPRYFTPSGYYEILIPFQCLAYTFNRAVAKLDLYKNPINGKGRTKEGRGKLCPYKFCLVNKPAKGLTCGNFKTTMWF